MGDDEKSAGPEAEGELGALWPRNVMGSEWREGLSDHIGDPDDGVWYGTSAHVVDVDLDRGKATEKLAAMYEERWTDEFTRAVAIDACFYNINYDIATVFRFQIDITLGGHFFPRVYVKSCRLNPYGPNDNFR